MSDNYHQYPVKIAERRERRAVSAELERHVSEIVETIRRCEAMWALEERIEKGR
jgi:hypothetical protein